MLQAFFASLGWAPPIAAFVAFCWYVLQIYESETAQQWLKENRTRRRAKKLIRLIAKERKIIAVIAALEKLTTAQQEANELLTKAEADAQALIERSKDEGGQ